MVSESRVSIASDGGASCKSRVAKLAGLAAVCRRKVALIMQDVPCLNKWSWRPAGRHGEHREKRAEKLFPLRDR